MVKLIREYDFKSADFLNYIEYALTSEIKKSRNNHQPVKITAGTRYTVTGKDNTSTKVTINKFDRNHLYSATFESLGEKLTVNYATKDLEKGCQIILTEDLLTYDSSKHNKIANLFYDFMYHRSAQEELNKLAKGVNSYISDHKK